MSENKRYGSVDELLRDTSDEPDFAENTAQHIADRRFIKHLIAHRLKNDLSQQEIANRMKCTQSRISKFESSNDSDIRLGDLQEYSKALGLQIRIGLFPDNQTCAEEVKYHAHMIRENLKSMAEIANSDDQTIANGITDFICFEVPYNVLKLVEDAAKRLPETAVKRIHDLTFFEPHCIACDQEECDEGLDNQLAVV